MTSDGRPYSRFQRALEVRSVMQAEAAARELGRARTTRRPRLPSAGCDGGANPVWTGARRWLTRLLDESHDLSLDDAQLALACLRSLPAGDVEQLRETLRALVRRKHGLARSV